MSKGLFFSIASLLLLITLLSAGGAVTSITAEFARLASTSLAVGDIRLDAVSTVTDDPNTVIFGTATSPPVAVKYNINTNSRAGDNTLNTNDGPIRAATTIGSNIYFAHQQSPARITRVKASDLNRIGSVSLNAGENDAGCIFANGDGSKLFVATTTTPSRIVRISVGSLSRDTARTLDSGDDFLQCGAYGGTTFSSFGFFGGGGYNAGVVVKMNLNGMSKISTLTLSNSFGYAEVNLMSVVVDGEYGYWSASRHIVKTGLRNNVRISAFPLIATHEFYPRAMVGDGTYLYAATSYSPSAIVQVRMSDLSRTAVVTLQQDFVRSAVAVNSSYAVFGSETGAASQIRMGAPGEFVNLTSLQCFPDMYDTTLAFGLLALFAWWLIIVFVGSYIWKWCYDRYACCRNNCDCCHPGHSCDPEECPSKTQECCTSCCATCQEQCCGGSSANAAATTAAASSSPLDSSSSGATVTKTSKLKEIRSGGEDDASMLDYGGGGNGSQKSPLNDYKGPSNRFSPRSLSETNPLSVTENVDDDAVLEEEIDD